MSNYKGNSYLFLQGPAGFFFQRLGAKIASENKKVIRVNFNGGDEFFWNDERSTGYGGKPQEFEKYLTNLDAKNNFDNLVLYGDCRFYHKIAINYFKKLNKNIWIFEEGYFRPYWVTLEKNGVNNFSTLPRNKEFYLEHKNLEEDEYKPTGSSLFKKGMNNYIYYIFREFLKYKYPYYLPHRTYSPGLEAQAWFKKILTGWAIKNYYLLKQKVFLKSNKKYFLFALQLANDSQIKEHCDYESLNSATEHVLKSFAEFSKTEEGKDYYIIVKTHPEESGIDNIKECVHGFAKKLGITKQMVYFNGGNMPKFLRQMGGFISVNSTAGISALHHHSKVICLGRAIYNFEGLCFSGRLDEFWTSKEVHDHNVFYGFKKYVMKNTQKNGSFYSEKGIEELLKNIEL